MESRRSTLQFVVATVILGSLGIFATQARLDARTIVFYRCLFGAIAMGIYCLFLGHFRAIPKQDFLLACGTGFLMLGNWVFFFEGILRVGVTVATIVYQVQPFIVLNSRCNSVSRAARPHEGTFVSGRASRTNPRHGHQVEYDRSWLPFGSRIYAAGSDSLCGGGVGRQGLEIG